MGIDTVNLEHKQMLTNSWEHWCKNKEDIPYFGFKEWLWEEYGVLYNYNQLKFHDSHKRLLFWMQWS